MELNKKKLVNSKAISHQQGIVDLLKPAKKQHKKIYIPGGADLYNVVNQDNAVDLVNNWLRGCAHFSEGGIFLARDISKYEHNTTLVTSFKEGPLPEWEREGKRWLATKVANILFNNKCLGVKFNKTGIYLIKETSDKLTFTPESEDFEPSIEFTIASTQKETR